jgi:starch synthase
MKILLASSEVHPYSKTGGLADMIGAMGKALSRAGHDVSVVTPLYRGVRERFPAIKPVDWVFDLPLGSSRVKAGLAALEIEKGLKVYFVEKPEYYDRAGIYNEHSVDYGDNAERFVFFSKCVVHLARYLRWKPEIVHVNDWQTGLVAAFIKDQSHREGWGNPPKVCLTVHNLAYQGYFPRAKFGLTNLPEHFFSNDGVESYGQLNCLKAGIGFADAITTVSPRYAREIVTEEFGCGLDGLLRKRQDRLTGILNGVDYDEWNTTNNPHLKHPYSVRSLQGKARIKSDLQQQFNLPQRSDVPLFGTITRLTEQKGMDIALGALEEMLQADMQYVLLGSGSPNYERAYQQLQQRYPQKVAVYVGFNQALSHQVEAACDFYIMPSRYEPCGLNQMYSLRYGTIPIVRTTGGLDDSIVDAVENSSLADGVKFTEYSAHALSKAIRKALVIYSDRDLMALYRRNGMTLDFSWSRTLRKYEAVYAEALRSS